MDDLQEKKMKLSMVSRGRNDNYGYLYLEKTQFCYNKHVRNFLELELTPDEVEIVFVDWGSENVIAEFSRRNIGCSSLKPEPLIHDEYGFLRYIVVPREITKLSDPPLTGFDFVKSINTGIVRCKGEYIMHIDLDVYMDTHSMENLWEYINHPTADTNYQHYFSRFSLDQKDYEDHLDDVNENFEEKVIVHENWPQLILGVFGGGSTAVMASKQAWYDVGGYDERYVEWGSQDVDLFNRFHMAGYPAKDLYKTNNVKLVHMNHVRFESMYPKMHCGNQDKGKHPNEPNWGLRDIEL
jgi:hypothetical protein